MKNRLALTAVTMMLLQATARPQTAAPVAMVLQVEGTVTIQRNNRSEPARLADMLQVSDRLAAGPNGRVVVGHCPANQKITVSAGAQVEVGAAVVRTLNGPAAVTSPLKCTLPGVVLGSENLERVGGIRPREPAPPSIVLYTGGPLTTARPMFRWEPISRAGLYKLTLMDQTGKAIWSVQPKAPASEARFPDTVQPLRPGIYEWALVAEAGTAVVARQSASFEVRPDSQISAPPSDPADRLLYAVTLESAGYFAEAAAIYGQIRDANPADARFTRHLVWLYTRANLPAARDAELTRLELQK